MNSLWILHLRLHIRKKSHDLCSASFVWALLCQVWHAWFSSKQSGVLVLLPVFHGDLSREMRRQEINDKRCRLRTNFERTTDLDRAGFAYFCASPLQGLKQGSALNTHNVRLRTNSRDFSLPIWVASCHSKTTLFHTSLVLWFNSNAGRREMVFAPRSTKIVPTGIRSENNTGRGNYKERLWQKQMV